MSHSLSARELDLLEEDMSVIERYRREPGRDPGERTLLAFQRAGRRIPALVAAARAHLEECVQLAPASTVGYWITCPSLLPSEGGACDGEWLSHDLLTAERIHRHLVDVHQLVEGVALRTVSALREAGRIP